MFLAHPPHLSPLSITVSAFCSSLSWDRDINEGYLLIILVPYDPLGKLGREKRPGVAGRRKGSQGMDR